MNSIRRGVVAVVVRERRLLVIRRAQGVAAPGAYCFPGGAIEPGETEADALVRELHEELALPIAPVTPLWRSTTSWNVDLTWWLATIAREAAPAPNPLEVQSVHWLAVEQLRSLPGLLESNHAFLDAWTAGEFEIAGL